SYIHNINGTRAIWNRLGLFNLILDFEHIAIAEELIKFLAAFETATTVLQASKSYPTVHLVLLFRKSIQEVFVIQLNDRETIVNLKTIMKQSFDTRFPILDIYLAASLLDPSQHTFDTDEYFKNLSMNKTELLC
ncbi:unnamed protein product, partial [Didymodactylos carnosus]